MTSSSPPTRQESVEATQRAVEGLRDCSGVQATHAAFAPGRVNLIGEHTDYNDGFVLPLAIEPGLYVAGRPRADRRVRIWSSEADATPAEWDLQRDVAPGAPSWSNYVRGVVVGVQAAGLPVTGFDAFVYADLPAGGGLSSSAALEVSFATLLESFAGVRLPEVEKALIGQKAEHDFAGTPCGIMDQFAVVMGRKDHLVWIDCRSQERRLEPFIDPAVTLVVVNTLVKHDLAAGEYARRRKECEAAAARLGVKSLREATEDQLEAARGKLDPVLYRRARHVVTENRRTMEAVSCLRKADWRRLGELMAESHVSLREDFQVSAMELDAVVQAAEEIGPSGGVWGCRMTGGGFGGCCVALVESAAVAEISEAVQAKYRSATGKRVSLFVTRPADGAHALVVP